MLADKVPSSIIFEFVTFAAFPPPNPFVITPPVRLTCVVGVVALYPPPYTLVLVPPVIYTNDSLVCPFTLFPPYTFVAFPD